MNGQYGPPGGMPFIDPKFFGRPFFRKWQLPPKPLHTFVGLVSCISNFPACMNCPSPSESRQRLMNASLKCMDCMKAQCGKAKILLSYLRIHMFRAIQVRCTTGNPRSVTDLQYRCAISK